MKSDQFSHTIKKLNMAAKYLDSTMTFPLYVSLICSHIVFVAYNTSRLHYYQFLLLNFTGMTPPRFHPLRWRFISRVGIAALSHSISLVCPLKLYL